MVYLPLILIGLIFNTTGRNVLFLLQLKEQQYTFFNILYQIIKNDSLWNKKMANNTNE
jgi:hypothetical protein